MFRSPSKQDGFTLIELLVVVVIIGILASVAVPNFMGAQDKAKNSGVQANGHNVQMAIEQYAVDNASVYPADLVAGGVVAPGSSYLTGFPKTPWNTQQGANIALTAAAGTALATGLTPPKSPVDGLAATKTAGANAVPTTVAHFGAISYLMSGNASEKYQLCGTGKNGNNAVAVFYMKNF
ncbi:MAG TPA: type II secretion system protein [Stenomitos sp.]